MKGKRYDGFEIWSYIDYNSYSSDKVLYEVEWKQRCPLCKAHSWMDETPDINGVLECFCGAKFKLVMEVECIDDQVKEQYRDG